LAREISADIFGNPDQVEFQSLTSANRIQALENDRVDLVIRSMSITCERRERITFSVPYYRAYQRVLAVRGSGIESIEDLEGKRVAVNPAAKGEYLTLLALEQAGVPVDSVERVPLQIKDGASAFSTGQVDAWASFNAPYQEAKANGAVELVNEGQLDSQDRRVLLVRGSVAQERPDVVAAFLATLQDLVLRQASEPADFQNVFTTTGPAALSGTRLEDAIAVGAQALPPVPPGEDEAAALEAVSRVFTENGVTPNQLSAQDVFLDLRPLVSPEQAARIDREGGR